ncbi:MAG: HipA domain-containing protein [Spirochaetaceae bacterium]|nr:HipA domain-containing protein [Spirochaetaceae bacterium]
MVKRLYIAMNNSLVGIWEHKSSGEESFQYLDSWINNPLSRGISLSLPVVKQKYNNIIVRNFFNNLIPERKNVIESIQRRYNISTNDSFELLNAIGEDCIGAIQISSDPDFLTQNKGVEGVNISDKEIAGILRNLRIPNSVNEYNEFDLRISLTGAQEKTALLFNNNSWMIPKRATATTHIFKTAIGKIPNYIDLSNSVENEWYCEKFFNNMKLSTASSQILTFEDQKVLVVKRFDRIIKENMILRLPQEDFCQILGIPSQQKYQSENGPSPKDIIEILKTSSNTKDCEIFFKALIVNWILGSTDAHAKNYSIFIGQNNTFQLTPFYDVMSFFPYVGNSRNKVHESKLKLAMAARGSHGNKYRIDQIARSNWLLTGKYLGLSNKTTYNIIEDVIEMVPIALDKTNNNLPKDFPTDIAESITTFVNTYLQRLKIST